MKHSASASVCDPAVYGLSASGVYTARQQYFPSVREYSRLYGLSRERVAALPEGALIMHPGPMNRGVEIASEVADLPQSVITEQVTNGIAIRMSLLYLILGGSQAVPAAEEVA